MAQTVMILYYSICVVLVVSRTSSVETHFQSGSSSNASTIIVAKAIGDGLTSNIVLDFEFEKICKTKNVSFAYENDACGAKSVTEFMETSKKQYTCLDRCGRKATYGLQNECSCDAMCLVFDDCCEDFYETCNEHSIQGKVFLSHFQTGSTACTDENFSVIFAVNSSTRYTLLTTVGTSTTIGFSTEFEEIKTKTLPRILRDVSSSLTNFKVLDTKYGVIFYNHWSFYTWRLPRSEKPIFLPVIRTYDCSKINKIPERSTVLDLVMECDRRNARYAKTSLYRNCLRYKVISCSCHFGGGETKRFFNLRRNACTGETTGVSLVARNKTLFESLKASSLDEYIGEEINAKECSITSISSSNSEYANRDLETENIFKVITTPIYQTKILDKDANRRSDNNIPIKEILRAGLDDQETKLDLDSIEFVVEMTKTVEKRIRCPTLDTLLTQCRLEECVPGALLWLDPPLHFKGLFKKGACFFPVKAVVKTESSPIFRTTICTCMRIMVALLNMGLWDVTLDRSEQSLCVFKMTALQVSTDDFEERVYDGTPIDYNFTATTTEIEALLQERLFISQFDCPDDEVYWLQICFYDEENKELSYCQLSMNIFAGFSEQKNVSKGGGTFNLSAFQVIFGLIGFVVFLQC